MYGTHSAETKQCNMMRVRFS